MKDKVAILKLADAYERYIQLISDNNFSGLAFAHGMKCSDEVVAEGKKWRKRIRELKKRYDVDVQVVENLQTEHKED